MDVHVRSLHEKRIMRQGDRHYVDGDINGK